MVALATLRRLSRRERRSSAVKQSITEKLTKEVRHSSSCCRGTPCFDNLAYKVEGDQVILYGQVTGRL